MKPIGHDMSNTRTPTPRPVFSSEKVLMDYTTVDKIYQRTGIRKEDLTIFVVKELLDNALDFIETNAGAAEQEEPMVTVKVTNDRITITNSNFGKEPFSKDMLNKIFSFDTFYSEKRNQYKISRGNLGDALKEVLSIPYALALDKGIEDWKEPLIIRGNKVEHLIYLNVDRMEQKINVDIEEGELGGLYQGDRYQTTVQVCLPPGIFLDVVRYKLNEFVKNYTILNPHIAFDLDLFNDDIILENKVLLPKTQDINPEWSNRPSIHYYHLPEFKQFINGLEDNDAVIYDVLTSMNFREVTNLSRSNAEMTVRELKQNPKQIDDLYNKLASALDSNSKLKAQFDTNKQTRREAIKKRVEDFGYRISDMSYRLVHESHYDDGIRVPYIFEMTILRVTNASNPHALWIVDGVNSSLRLYSPFTGKAYDTYVWASPGAKWLIAAKSIHEILERYGYSRNRDKAKKPPSVIMLNLISARMDYQGYSKSEINLKPFAKTIADTVYKLCSRTVSIGRNCEKMTGKDVLVEVLAERWQAVQKNPNLKRTDRWTQSTVYYKTRKKMMDREMKGVTRKYLTSLITKVCWESWGKTREDLGIFAADRAQLYFGGKVYNVSIEELPSLMEKGTDLLVIEKEGVAEVLTPYADRYGIAILNTRGFLVEYAKDLSELSEHVTILTDFDDSGLLLAKKVSDIPRIGIDFDTLEFFNVRREDVEESYDEDHTDKHYQPLEVLAEEDLELKSLLPYIKNKRIEIDSVLTIVGNEHFWNFCLNKLKELFPNRNYNRAIDVPQDLIPEEVEDFIDDVKDICNNITEDQRDEIEGGLEEVEGFIDDVHDNERCIKKRIRDVLSDDKDIQSLVSDIQVLQDKLDLKKIRYREIR